MIWATGRSGNPIFGRMFGEIPGIKSYEEPPLFGARVEVPYKTLSHFTEAIWAPCFSTSPIPFAEEATFTFCTCPNGRVLTENHDGEFLSANGESSPDFRSGKTNFALLTTIKRQDSSSPNQTVIDWAKAVNQLANGGVFRIGFPALLKDNPLFSVLPSEVIHKITGHLLNLNRVAPGVAGEQARLIFPELKLRGTKVSTGPFMETGPDGLFVAGDVAVSNNLYDAALTGLAAADGVARFLRSQ